VATAKAGFESDDGGEEIPEERHTVEEIK